MASDSVYVCSVENGEIEAERDAMVIVMWTEVVVIRSAQFDMMLVLHR